MTASDPSASRRSKRSAARAAGRATSATPAAPRRSPIVLLSVGIVLIAVLAIGGVALVSGLGNAASAPIASPNAQAAADLADGRVLGKADAPVTVEVWADFQCPVCRRFTDNVEPLLRAGYIQTGAVRLLFHDMAFIGEESVAAAAAARISDEIGPGFWPMHDLLYANQGAENGGSFDRDRLAAMAVRLGMDRDAFLSALDAGTAAAAVRAETADGAALGVSSTPTLRIGGTLYPGLPSWDQLAQLIDDQLAAAGSAAPVPSAAA